MGRLRASSGLSKSKYNGIQHAGSACSPYPSTFRAEVEFADEHAQVERLREVGEDAILYLYRKALILASELIRPISERVQE